MNVAAVPALSTCACCWPVFGETVQSTGAPRLTEVTSHLDVMVAGLVIDTSWFVAVVGVSVQSAGPVTPSVTSVSAGAWSPRLLATAVTVHSKWPRT